MQIDADPGTDGTTHINAYSRGRTQLGRMLSNLANIGLRHPVYGAFATAEGFFFWLKTGKCHNEFRTLDGKRCRRLGKSLEHENAHPGWPEEFESGLEMKVIQHDVLRRLMVDSELPFAHYYVFGSRANDKPPVVRIPKSAPLFIGMLERIRAKLKAGAST